jgi:hypothetical protein
MEITDHIKSASVSSVISIAATAIMGWLWVSSQFANAEDVKVLKDGIPAQIQQLRIEQQQGQNAIRRATVEDKIFELQLKEKLNYVDQALLDRYKRQLELTK